MTDNLIGLDPTPKRIHLEWKSVGGYWSGVMQLHEKRGETKGEAQQRCLLFSYIVYWDAPVETARARPRKGSMSVQMRLLGKGICAARREL